MRRDDGGSAIEIVGVSLDGADAHARLHMPGLLQQGQVAQAMAQQPLPVGRRPRPGRRQAISADLAGKHRLVNVRQHEEVTLADTGQAGERAVDDGHHEPAGAGDLHHRHLHQVEAQGPLREAEPARHPVAVDIGGVDHEVERMLQRRFGPPRQHQRLAAIGQQAAADRLAAQADVHMLPALQRGHQLPRQAPDLDHGLVSADAHRHAVGIDDVGGRAHFVEAQVVGAAGGQVAFGGDLVGKRRNRVIGLEVADDHAFVDRFEIGLGLLHLANGFDAARVMEAGMVPPLVDPRGLLKQRRVPLDQGDLATCAQFDCAGSTEHTAAQHGHPGSIRPGPGHRARRRPQRRTGALDQGQAAQNLGRCRHHRRAAGQHIEKAAQLRPQGCGRAVEPALVDPIAVLDGQQLIVESGGHVHVGVGQFHPSHPLMAGPSQPQHGACATGHGHADVHHGTVGFAPRAAGFNRPGRAQLEQVEAMHPLGQRVKRGHPGLPGVGHRDGQGVQGAGKAGGLLLQPRRQWVVVVQMPHHQHLAMPIRQCLQRFGRGHAAAQGLFDQDMAMRQALHHQRLVGRRRAGNVHRVNTVQQRRAQAGMHRQTGLCCQRCRVLCASHHQTDEVDPALAGQLLPFLQVLAAEAPHPDQQQPGHGHAPRHRATRGRRPITYRRGRHQMEGLARFHGRGPASGRPADWRSN